MWGKHLILDLGRCCRIAVKNPDTIRAFARDLVKKIDMEPYGEPQVVHFGSGKAAGNTLVQLITTVLERLVSPFGLASGFRAVTRLKADWRKDSRSKVL